MAGCFPTVAGVCFLSYMERERGQMKEFNLSLDGNRMMRSRQPPTDDTSKWSRVG